MIQKDYDGKVGIWNGEFVKDKRNILKESPYISGNMLWNNMPDGLEDKEVWENDLR